MRIARYLIVALAVGGVAYAVVDLARKPTPSQPASKNRQQVVTPPKQLVTNDTDRYARRRQAIVSREPVAANCSDKVCKSFAGSVHPLLHGQTHLTLAAEWTRIGLGRDKLEKSVPDFVYSIFRDLKVAEPSRTYTERDFSAFLPQDLQEVGQLWELPSAGVCNVLKQFHPKPSTTLVAPGRRAGPNGAYAILRGMSAEYLDIMFRVHAEFDLTPEVWDHPDAPMVGAWYTPAFLRGRMIVNRKAGTVEYFRIEHPSERTQNVHLTYDHGRGNNHDIVRVERMQIVGGNDKLPQSIAWDEEVETADAELELSKVFYKFMEIKWRPVSETLAEAKKQNKPIFAMVFWGSVDDQSC